MNELAINIEFLLLTRNCVIVPGLGAFTTSTFASQWLEEEEIFLPPVRHIRFNADVFQDPDDVFIHSLMQIYNADEEYAQTICDRMVSEFHKSLVTEGTVDFGSIGLFTLEDDAEITMSPYECGVVSPDYYGLDTLHFPLLANLPEVQDNTEDDVASSLLSDDASATILQPQKRDEDSTSSKAVVLPKARTYVADSKHIIIRLNRAFVHYSMVTAASILLFFLLSPNVMNDQAAENVKEATTNLVLQGTSKTVNIKETTNDVSNVVSEDENIQLAKRDSSAVLGTSDDNANIQLVVSDHNNVQPSEDVNDLHDDKVNVVDEENKIFTELRGSYSIVLASAVSKKNAASFVERLQAMDVHAIMYDNGKMLRVVIDGFASQADAYNVNNYLHNLDKDLRSTWVMKN